MKTTIQTRLALLEKARKYSLKMQKGSAFATDFTAMYLLDELINTMQEMLAENLKLKEEIKSNKIFNKRKKE
jgi:hypothetical protein